MDGVAAKMIAAKPYAKNYWSNGDALLEMIRSGEVTVAMDWDNGGWKLPAENPDIDFIGRPENAAVFSNMEKYATASKDAAKYLDADVRNNISRSFTAADIDNIKWYPPVSAEIEQLEGKILDMIEAAKQQRHFDNPNCTVSLLGGNAVRVLFFLRGLYMAPVLDIQNLKKCFGKIIAVGTLNFQVEDGCFFPSSVRPAAAKPRCS